MTPPDDDQRPSPRSGDGFKAAEALVTGMFLGPLTVALVVLVLSNTGLEWTWEYWGRSDGTFDRSAIFRNFGLLALALIAFPLAVWRSWTAHQQARSSNRQTELAEKGLIIDRYQKGAQMLESKDLSVRLAGIYALRELVWSDPNESYLLVLDLLFDFVRERSKERTPDLNALTSEANELRYGPFPSDLQKAIETASSLRTGIPNAEHLEKEKNWLPDLRAAVLTDLILDDANMAGAILTDANLSFGHFVDADFSGADLTRANLNLALLESAILSKANLEEAMLMRTDLVNADLAGCDLLGANFTEANLMQANLQKALCFNTIFNRAILESVNLNKSFCFSAIFTDAVLTNAKLESAYFVNAEFFCSNLSAANLTNANLSDADLSGAVLADAILIKTNLSGTILDDVELTDVDFSSAVFADQPEGGGSHL
ncbi:pentapeptide repeat-containing protein [Roseibium sp.]|uniref:pentapeptide repeat-containing protein n=1 Tax=Roseibium sp. TaxID=1936156 RepID=UPI001B280CFA|nr:pentapeptide repeat-containing protein [Roseibium sp.]MBO6857582.1 pentapeptide repeat-containing protein [Roseibium sp.]